MRRACDQCLGTDMQYECERGACYAEHCEREDERRAYEERRQEEEAWQQQAEEDEQQ